MLPGDCVVAFSQISLAATAAVSGPARAARTWLPARRSLFVSLGHQQAVVLPSLRSWLGGAWEVGVRAFGRFGRCAGIAFQCGNDILGLWGEGPQCTGRPVGGDVTSGKKTYPLLVACADCGQAGQRVRELCAVHGLWTRARSGHRVAQINAKENKHGGVCQVRAGGQ
ncbi:polyprenyl synthetase family protein [Streptomyces sp. NPDC048324]|uniref:polyprenyl synthetase family protein n=1 Tax=Streptomyces sp. NPDC048324 TaxID=3157205 RepID=UPI003412B7E9